MNARQPELEQKENLLLKSQRTGILVIHGIGEQNPYETLDSFARGLVRFFKTSCGGTTVLEPREIAHKDWTEVAMRIEVTPVALGQQPSSFDVHEYYWAPLTEEQISLKQTLLWLLRTDLSPLRYFSDNLQEMLGTGRRGSEQGKSAGTGAVARERESKSARLAWLFWRELRRVFLVFVPVAVLLVALMVWLGTFSPSAVAEAFKPLRVLSQGEPWWGRAAVSLGYVLAAVMLYLVLQSVLDWMRRRASIQKVAQTGWLLGTVAIVVPFFLGISAWIERVYQIDMSPVWAAVTRKHFLYGLGALVAAAVVSNFLVKFMGDVAVYVNADAKAKSYVARSAILDGATKALTQLLTSDDYDNVVLVGHSLGSVIAYDTINEIITAVSAQSNPGEEREVSLSYAQLKKLTGLVTFGSPLDKIYYFFREHVAPDQAIRGQILSMLHSFRKAPSGRKYGDFKFTYTRPRLEQLRWLNAWSPLDPVSARLHFYDVDVQKWFWYWRPVLAHLSYWDDPRFYRFIARELFMAPQQAAAAATASAQP